MWNGNRYEILQEEEEEGINVATPNTDPQPILQKGGFHSKIKA